MRKLSFVGAIFALLFVAGSAGVMVGCGGSGGSTFTPESQGGPYEIVVVADHAEWDGPAGDTLRAAFSRRVPMINRQETMFDVLRVLPSNFKDLVTRHQNVLVMRIDPTIEGPLIAMQNDVWANPQIVVTASAPSAAELAELVGEHKEDLLLVLEGAQRARDAANAAGHTPANIATLIQEKFGIKFSTGPGYEVRSESDDFLWLSYEMPTASQGIVFYTYPFGGSTDMAKESLLARRNEFVARIPGENPGSHMITTPDFIELNYKNLAGRPWAEMRGFWDVKGDFMGGPFTNYSTLDAAGNRIVAIDFYVYSPDTRPFQRNLIRQLEHKLDTFSIVE